MKLIRKGIQKLVRTVALMLAKTFTYSILQKATEYSSTTAQRSYYYRFILGEFVEDADGRPDFSARNYYEISQLQSVIRDYAIRTETSLEVGCGFGRMSPWIAEHSSNHYAVDPNKRAIDNAESLYPHLNFINSRIQDINLTDRSADLIISYTVLQHIPDSHIHDAVESISGTSSNNSTLILCEEATSKGGDGTFPRQPSTYA